MFRLNDANRGAGTEEYTYTETEEYEYRILTVKMDNHQIRKAVEELTSRMEAICSGLRR